MCLWDTVTTRIGRVAQPLSSDANPRNVLRTYGLEHFAYTRVANEFLAYCAMAHTALMLTVTLSTASFTYLKRHTLWPS